MCDFEKNVKRYAPLINSLIHNKYIDGYEKEDLLQECHMKLYECMKTFDPSKGIKFSTYLYTSIRNMLTNMLIGQAIEKKPKLIFMSGDDPTLLNAVDDINFENEDYASILQEIVKELMLLPRGYVTYLIYIGGKTQQEVADLLGISKQRVSVLNKRNLTALSSIFEDRGLTK